MSTIRYSKITIRQPETLKSKVEKAAAHPRHDGDELHQRDS